MRLYSRAHFRNPCKYAGMGNVSATDSKPSSYGLFSRSLFGLSLIVVLSATALAGYGGYLLGPLNGDIPWPATSDESGAYYAGRNLIYVAAGVAVAGVVSLIFLAKKRGSSPFAWPVITASATTILALGAFAGAYALSA